MKTPVLLILFNRPKHTKIMIQALKKANVSKLYVFKDGPRPHVISDCEASIEIEKEIASIDWECQVKTNYMQNNLGCGFGPYSAISWAFQYEEELIILEDDCIPSIPFFQFCTDMLNLYKNNSSVRLISGRSQWSEHPVFKENNYIFTQYAPTWGWATWKRVWKNFDIQMRNLEVFFDKGGFDGYFSSTKEDHFFNKRYFFTKKHLNSMITHIWDYQFGLYGRTDHSLGIVPSKNLIHYIGVSDYGTGTHMANNGYANLCASDTFTYSTQQKEVLLSDKTYDYKYFMKFIYSPQSKIEKINFRLKKIIHS